MADVTISGAGAHASAEGTDRIPASKVGVKGYLTNSQIETYLTSFFQAAAANLDDWSLEPVADYYDAAAVDALLANKAAVGANNDIDSVALANTGLRTDDNDASHLITLKLDADVSANRTWSLRFGNAARFLDISAADVTISSFAATYLDDADGATTRATLGLTIGTNVQAYDALLAAVAGLTTAQGDLFYATGSDAVAVLNKNASATRYLSNTGASNNPAWAQIDLSNGVTGDLPFANFVQAGSAGFVGATGSGDYSHRTPTQVTAALDVVVGDSGSGGTKGLVPAPASGDAKKHLQGDGTWADDLVTVLFVVDGGGSVISTGVKGDLYFPFQVEIQQVTLLGDQSGSIVLDLWVDTRANHPATVADTIVASAKPTISSATQSEDATLTGWSKTIAAGKTMRVNVDSVTTLTRCTMALKCKKT